MRGRGWKIAASGVAAGVALVVALTVSPASAAKPGGGGTVAATHSCATFEGMTSTESYVSYNGVALRAGESITARVTPASPGDQISLNVANGLSFTFFGAEASQGLVFTAAAGGVYSLGWRLLTAGTAPAAVTWTFDCSSTSAASAGGTTPVVSDADRDGVADSADACAGTILPDAVSKPVAGRYFANRAGQFVDGANRSAGVTVVDAGGCSAVQIAKALRLSPKDSRSGLTLTQLQSWASTH